MEMRSFARRYLEKPPAPLSPEERSALLSVIRRRAERKRFFTRKRFSPIIKLKQKTLFDRGTKGAYICLSRPYKLSYFDRVERKKVGEEHGEDEKCRAFTEEEMSCLHTATATYKLSERKDIPMCEKVKLALACVDHLSPTMTSSLLNLPKKKTRVCLETLKKENVVSAAPSELAKTRPEEFFLDEPIFHATPEKKEETLKAVERLKEAVAI